MEQLVLHVLHILVQTYINGDFLNKIIFKLKFGLYCVKNSSFKILHKYLDFANLFAVHVCTVDFGQHANVYCTFTDRKENIKNPLTLNKKWKIYTLCNK
jgi:hypothetical protein